MHLTLGVFGSYPYYTATAKEIIKLSASQTLIIYGKGQVYLNQHCQRDRRSRCHRWTLWN